MTATILAKTTAPGAYAAAATLLTLTAADAVNGNRFVAAGNDLLVIQNTGAVQRAYTITSALDPFGRTGTITAATIEAGEIKVYGPMRTLGWIQSDGYIYFGSSSTEVKFGVVAL